MTPSSRTPQEELVDQRELAKAIGAMIVHLNDDHGWTREHIAEWLSNGAPGPRHAARS